MDYRSGVAAAAWAAMVVSSTPSLAQTPDGAPGRRPPGAETCPTTRNLADGMWANNGLPSAGAEEHLERWAQEIRGETAPAPVPPDASAVLRAFGGWSETQSVATDSVSTVWREANGTWRFHKVDWAKGGPPPPPPPPGEIALAHDPRTVSSGVISPSVSEALTALIEDHCLMLEPASTGPMLEVRRGVPAPPPCYSGAGGTVQLTQNGRTRSFGLFCPRMLSGELLRLALYPVADDGVPVSAYTRFYASADEAGYAVALLRATHGSDPTNWPDETVAPGPLLLRHASSGFLCALPRDPLAYVGSSGENGSCSWTDWTGGEQRYRARFTRGSDRRALIDRMQDRAPDQVRAGWGDGRGPDPRSVRIEGRPVSVFQFADSPLADAREETYTRVYGAQIGEWQVVWATTGPATDRTELDIAHEEGWRALLASRSPRP